MPKKVEIAYAAGLFDGEGSISASRSYRCQKNIRVLVSVGMCDRQGPEFMARIFGGRVRQEKRPTKSGKPVFTWAAYCRNAADILESMLPYLRVKHERAQAAIRLARMMRPRGNQRAVIIPMRQLEARNNLAAEIKAANIAANGRIARHAAKTGIISGHHI